MSPCFLLIRRNMPWNNKKGKNVFTMWHEKYGSNLDHRVSIILCWIFMPAARTDANNMYLQFYPKDQHIFFGSGKNFGRLLFESRASIFSFANSTKTPNYYIENFKEKLNFEILLPTTYFFLCAFVLNKNNSPGRRKSCLKIITRTGQTFLLVWLSGMQIWSFLAFVSLFWKKLKASWKYLFQTCVASNFQSCLLWKGQFWQ